MNQRILLAEQLLADAATWQQASSSMRTEAAGMLAALVADFQSLPDVSVAVLLSSRLPIPIRSAVAPEETRAEIIEVSDSGLSDWFHGNPRRAAQFSGRLLIAPEAGGILSGLLRELNQTEWSSVRSLNLPVADVECFSDKLQTAEWLIRNSIATPATIAVSDDRARTLLRMSLLTEAAKCVLKPRFGAGSDQIHLVNFAFQDADPRNDTWESDPPWVLQPRIAGTDCSIGIIGGGESSDPMILPPARQILVENEGQLHYSGGEVPFCGAGAARLSAVARRIADGLERFSGYIGIDAVIPDSSFPETEPVVIEINPRLCTSYLGYRRLSGVNLASVILNGLPAAPIAWSTGSVRFLLSGPDDPQAEVVIVDEERARL